RVSGTRLSQFGNDLIISWNVEPQAIYERMFAGGRLQVLAGVTFLQSQSNQQKIIAWGFNNDVLMENISAASTVFSDGTVNALYKYNAVFGRLNYKWQDKYLLNVNARRDGSSRFGSENLFNNFWSVGAAW